MMSVDIDREILENIDIDIDKEILENIDIDKISNRLEFGISNRAIDKAADEFADCYNSINYIISRKCENFYTNG